MCPPFAAKTARQRHFMLQISFLMTSNGILTHSACTSRSRSRMLLTSWCSLTWQPKWSHRCSLGERSGDLAGHCNTLTLWMHKIFWVCLAVCWQALLFWKISTLCCWEYCTTTGSIIPSHQRNANVGTYAFNRAACSLFLTVLLQTLVPVVFLS